MQQIRTLLKDSISNEQKYRLLLDTIKTLRKSEQYSSYNEIIQRIIPILQKNIEYFECHGSFLSEDLLEYVEAYGLFLQERAKYQIWLLGDKESCLQVQNLLNHDKIHLLGIFQSADQITDTGDYIITCSKPAGQTWDRLANCHTAKIVRYDLIRLIEYEISPEIKYLCMELERQFQKSGKDIEGAVTGLSYEQVGLNYKALAKNLACLASPAQDLYLDYHRFIWLYHEITRKYHGTIKYCIIGMDFYRLWYDLSMSNEKGRMLLFYKYLHCLHHCHEMAPFQFEYAEAIHACNEIMIENYLNQDFQNHIPQALFQKRESVYDPAEEDRRHDIEEIRKIFHKPYPATLRENTGILERFLKFLTLRNIKTLIYIPPFPKIFNDFTPENMKNETWNILYGLCESYKFDILDLSGHPSFENRHFADWSHLNDAGAGLATELLNNCMRQIWEN